MGEKSISPMYDLIITDGFTLSYFMEKHIDFKNDRDPVFRPVLLVTSKKDLNLMTGQVWQVIDEIITIPIAKMELLARTEILLRARRQSIRLHEQNALLAKDVGRLKDRANALVDSFANMSHELRTPLTVMLAGIESMVSRYRHGQAGPEECLNSLRIMKQNGFRLLRLLNNLLDLTRLDGGGMPFFLRNIDLAESLSRIVTSIGDYARIKKIEVSFASDAQTRLIAVDEDKFERIMLNLLSNAIKFTGEGGRIQLGLRDGRDGESVVITVEDDGPGIAPEKQDVIFERFRQAGEAPETGAGGCGLGLPLVKSLAELLKGRVWVDSAPGKGSTFGLELPARKLQTNVPKKSGAGLNSHVDLELSDLGSSSEQTTLPRRSELRSTQTP
jgi:signal transduction histidine kinase